MSGIAGITGTTSSNELFAQENSSESKRSSLDKNAFFKLLTTQLKHQDPLKPMDNTQFISQMAQFSSLEQMNNMNDNLGQFLRIQGISEGATLIGKTVETVDSDSGRTIKGKVSQVGFEDGQMFAYLESGGKIAVEGISKIY